MKKFNVEGYDIEFDEPTKCQKISEILGKNNEVLYADFKSDNSIDYLNDKPELRQKLTEYFLFRFYKAYVSQELISKEHLKKNDILKVNSPILYDADGNKIEHNEPADLLLLDDETGECVALVYVNKLKQINKIKDVDIRQHEYEKISVWQRSIVEYRVGDRTVSGVVLGIGLDFYYLIDKEDYFALLFGKKECKEVVLRFVRKDCFESLLCRLDETYIRFNQFIKGNCKTISYLKKFEKENIN